MAILMLLGAVWSLTRPWGVELYRSWVELSSSSTARGLETGMTRIFPMPGTSCIIRRHKQFLSARTPGMVKRGQVFAFDKLRATQLQAERLTRLQVVSTLTLGNPGEACGSESVE